VAIWKKLIETAPQEAHLILGRLKKTLFDLGRFGVISDICRDILSISKDNLDARLTLAEYHLKKGEYDLAIEHLSLAAENHPDSFLPVLELARLYLITDNKDKLEELLSRLLSLRSKLEKEYLCSECGHRSESKIWLCPSCQAVNSFKR
jgi:lipopolysaccharide biosynthesis regulator YciM